MSSINTCNCNCVEECHEHCQRVLDETDGFAADLAEVSDSLCNYVQVHEHDADVDRLGAVIEQVQDEAHDTLKVAESAIHETESLRGDLEQLSANCADFVSDSDLDNALQTVHVRNDQIEGSIQDLDVRTAGAEHLASACKERLDAFDSREFFLDQQTAELKGELHHLHSTTADLVQAVADNVYTALSAQLSRILRNEDSIHCSLLTHQFHADTSKALWSAHVDLDRDVEDRLCEYEEKSRAQQLQIQQQHTELHTADQNFHVGIAVATGRLQSVEHLVNQLPLGLVGEPLRQHLVQISRPVATPNRGKKRNRCTNMIETPVRRSDRVAQTPMREVGVDVNELN